MGRVDRMDGERGPKPEAWNLAGQIIYWLGRRSRRFNRSLLAILIIGVALIVLVSVASFWQLLADW